MLKRTIVMMLAVMLISAGAVYACGGDKTASTADKASKVNMINADDSKAVVKQAVSADNEKYSCPASKVNAASKSACSSKSEATKANYEGKTACSSAKEAAVKTASAKKDCAASCAKACSPSDAAKKASDKVDEKIDLNKTASKDEKVNSENL